MKCPVERVDVTNLAHFGNRAAIVSGQECVTYAALAERVAARACELQRHGMRPGDAVLIKASHSVSTIVDMLALLHVEAFQVPVSRELTATEVSALAEQARATRLLDDGTIAPTSVIADGRRNDTACLGLLSSGSTGRPKLVLRSAEHVAAAMEIYAQAVGLSEDDRVLALLPLEHSYGFHNVVLATLGWGATLVLQAVPHPRLALRTILDHAITILPAAPVFFELLVKFAGAAPPQLPLRAAISVGTALSRRIYDAFFEAFALPLWQSYGTSETGPVALARRGTPHGDFLALGEVLPGVRVTIVDENGTPQSEPQVGEIVIESPAVGIGYDGPNDGASRFDGRLFYTGDLGFFRDGELYFAGRRKLLIAAAGHKVDPLEIEQVLKTHPAVRDAAVVGKPDSHGIEQITAYVCASPGLTHAELLAHCAQHLASYKVPRTIYFRDSLPRNAMGKLLRDKLQ